MPASPLITKLDNGFDFVWPEYNAYVAVTDIAEDIRRHSLSAEVKVQILRTKEEGPLPLLSAARLTLTSAESRFAIATTLNKAQDNIGLPVPWTDLLEQVCRETIGQYRQTKSESPEVILRSLSEIKPETVNWLWKPYIPLGKLTLLEGDPGVGKSWVALAIATGVSLGKGIAGQLENISAPVLLASAEDGLADTIRPRLDAMGADIKAIQAVDGLFTLDDAGFAMLEGWVQTVLPGLTIIDPIVAYLSSDVDIHRANQVRHATARLSKLAGKYGTAILAIRHLTKGGSLKPIYRGLGSIDFTASARSVLLAGCDPDDPKTRGIVHIKSNLAPLGEAIGYGLGEDGFHWTGHSELTTEKIFAASDSGSALNEAKSFLLDLLSDGEVPAKEGFDEASARGITEPTLKRAKKELHIITRRVGEEGKKGGGKWSWKLPENGGEASQDRV